MGKRITRKMAKKNGKKRKEKKYRRRRARRLRQEAERNFPRDEIPADHNVDGELNVPGEGVQENVDGDDELNAPEEVVDDNVADGNGLSVPEEGINDNVEGDDDNSEQEMEGEEDGQEENQENEVIEPPEENQEQPVGAVEGSSPANPAAEKEAHPVGSQDNAGDWPKETGDRVAREQYADEELNSREPNNPEGVDDNFDGDDGNAGKEMGAEVEEQPEENLEASGGEVEESESIILAQESHHVNVDVSESPEETGDLHHGDQEAEEIRESKGKEVDRSDPENIHESDANRIPTGSQILPPDRMLKRRAPHSDDDVYYTERQFRHLSQRANRLSLLELINRCRNSANHEAAQSSSSSSASRGTITDMSQRALELFHQKMAEALMTQKGKPEKSWVECGICCVVKPPQFMVRVSCGCGFYAVCMDYCVIRLRLAEYRQDIRLVCKDCWRNLLSEKLIHYVLCKLLQMALIFRIR
ncbi:OLC1v1001543C1 [Oldenlandia corymbosa var. corymbosa]|uniref:OLC1v1001543C1 n=1 Tax=Oldenlandia corymbosa var. corymbosa TaxID=529605 RepID=A0AAV1D8Y0_OLDCO|nr:OLC1v1001543C1 [Oldenlandia corymbosa var. corymbosa]